MMDIFDGEIWGCGDSTIDISTSQDYAHSSDRLMSGPLRTADRALAALSPEKREDGKESRLSQT